MAVQIFTRLLSHPGFYSVVAEADGRIVASNVLDERSTIAAARCSMQSNKRVQTVVEHNDRVTGYATSIRWFEHAVGETNEELKALIGASPGCPGPGFLLPTLNDELACGVVLMTMPDGLPVAGIVVCYNGPIEKRERVLQPLRSFGSPVADEIDPSPYTVAQKLVDAFYPPGLQEYWKSSFLTEISMRPSTPCWPGARIGPHHCAMW